LCGRLTRAFPAQRSKKLLLIFSFCLPKERVGIDFFQKNNQTLQINSRV